MQTINVDNCTRVWMRSIAGPFKPLRVAPEWQERVLSMFSFGFKLFSNVFSPMQKIKDDKKKWVNKISIIFSKVYTN